ncbi:MAG: hypothetical protein ACI89D_001119 [Bermanella sp.]|jgi:hypothetical protein
MKRLLMGFALSFSLVIWLPVALADVLALKDDHPKTYAVKKGDTLWSISRMFLEDPWLWPELWHYNQQLDDPHLIYPGDILYLIWVDGKPRLVKSIATNTVENRDVKLTPQMRIVDLQESIPSISLDVIGPFLTNSRVVDLDTLERAPYVVSGREGHIVTGAGDTLYARGEFGENSVYGIYRRGQVFKDPETGEVLGIQARDVGSGKRLSQEGSIATLQINRSNQEIRRGDRLLSQEDRSLKPRFEPKAPDADVEGEIIGVEGGVSQVGSMDVIILNRGERNGLKSGDVLSIYQRGELVRDEIADETVRVPDIEAGVLMVFRSYEKVAFAVVLSATQALRVGDKVRNPG